MGLGGTVMVGAEEVCPSIIYAPGELQDHRTDRR